MVVFCLLAIKINFSPKFVLIVGVVIAQFLEFLIRNIRRLRLVNLHFLSPSLIVLLQLLLVPSDMDLLVLVPVRTGVKNRMRFWLTLHLYRNKIIIYLR